MPSYKSFSGVSKRQQRRIVNTANNRRNTTSFDTVNTDTSDSDSSQGNPNLDDNINLNLSEDELLNDNYHQIYSEDDEDAEIIDSPTRAEHQSERVKRKLKIFISNHQLSTRAVDDLLRILRIDAELHYLPLTKVTLMDTPIFYESRKVSPGNYNHSGVRESIHRLLTVSKIEPPELLILDFNMDGVPVGKSSGSSAWPILCHIVNIPRSQPFIVGVYYGHSKPHNFNDYIKDFVDEIVFLYDNGIEYKEKNLKIKIRAFICDAPARAELKGIRGHTGYCACERCDQHGQDFKNRVVFFNSAGESRTHESFVLKLQPHHHHDNYQSLILEIPNVDIIRDFPLEYMHLGLLGNMKKILVFLVQMRSNPAALAQSFIKKINSNLDLYNKFIPTEFTRRPRPLSDLSRYKCTELRLFLFYLTPIIFKNILSRELYNHFMHFQVAMTLMARKDLYESNFETAQSLFEYFLATYGNHYGDESISYCVHSVIHIVEDVKRFGPLDEYSAFKFENTLGKVRNSIKGFSKPLQQMVRRQRKKIGLELLVVPPNYPELVNKHGGGPVPDTILPQNCTQYKRVNFSNFCLTLSPKNDKIITEYGEIVIVRNIIAMDDCKYVVGQKYTKRFGDFYTTPCNSSDLDVYKVDTRFLSPLKLYPFSIIAKKCMLLPYESYYFVSVPLIHTQLS